MTVISRRKITAKRIAFTVSFNKVPGASVEDCRAYVEEAVAIWRGQTRPPGSIDDSDPGDPMWGLDGDSVEVKRAFMRKGKP